MTASRTPAESLEAQGLQRGIDFETVGDILERADGNLGDAPAAPFCPPRLGDTTPPVPESGIYLNMDEELYHSIHACSASGLKKLSVSTLDYWACSVLNPDRDDGDTKAKALGRAYHCRICEGLEVYQSRYAIELDKADHPDVLITMDDIRARLEELGLKAAKSKEDSFARLLEYDPDAKLWDRMVAEHAEENEGRTMLRAIDHRRIQIAAKMIESDPELGKAFTGGHPEISVFWIDEKSGVPCKSRIDYLKMHAFVDLKTFSDPYGRPVSRAIDYAIANQRYYMAVVFYTEAVEAAKRMIRERGASAVFGADDPAWFLKFAQVKDLPTAFYVFQKTGIAPVTRGRVMARGTVYDVNENAVQWLRRKWRHCCETFVAEPWIDTGPIEQTTDENIPLSATDFGDYQ